MARMDCQEGPWTGCGRYAEGYHVKASSAEKKESEKKDGMGYDTVCFLLAEEDKQSAPPYSIGSMFLMSMAMVTYPRRTWYFMRSCRYVYADHCILSSSAAWLHTPLHHTSHPATICKHTRTGPPRGDERGGCALRGDH